MTCDPTVPLWLSRRLTVKVRVKKAVIYNRKRKEGGLGGFGGLGGLGRSPPPVVTKKEFDTTRKQRGEGRVSANSKFKF